MLDNLLLITLGAIMGYVVCLTQITLDLQRLFAEI